MDYSRKISERMWNQPDKGERESRREDTFIDDIVQKSHIEKELLSSLEEIETYLSVSTLIHIRTSIVILTND